MFCKTALICQIKVYDHNPVKKEIKSEMIYRFQPVDGEYRSAELDLLIRYDSLGRVIEGKDIRHDGSLYSWWFNYYDSNGNEVKSVRVDEDSVLSFTEYNIYDDKNRVIQSTDIRKSGKKSHESKYYYTENKKVYEGWFSDSSSVSTYVTNYNELGLVESEFTYDGKGADTVIESYTSFEYKDSVLLKKVKRQYYNNKVIETYPNVTFEYEIGANNEKILEKELRYDTHGNEIYEKYYGGTDVWKVTYWENRYDSLNRPVSISEYLDTINYKPNEDKLVFRVTFHYFKISQERCTTMNQYRYLYNSYYISDSVHTKQRTTCYDQFDRLLHTTETENGRLVYYRYAVYEYRDE